MVLEARCINCRSCSIGIGMRPCKFPGSSQSMWILDESSVELGIGLHGEAGIARMQVRCKRDCRSATLEVPSENCLNLIFKVMSQLSPLHRFNGTMIGG